MIKEVKIPDGTQWANIVDEIETTVEDTGMIIWVGSADGRYAMPWGQFKAMFYDTEYRVQGGYCALASDLVVAMDDGSWYEQADNGYFYHRWPPQLQPGFRPFKKVTGQGSGSLEELNTDDKADVWLPTSSPGTTTCNPLWSRHSSIRPGAGARVQGSVG